MKSRIAIIFIAGTIAIPLSIYGSEQAKLNAEVHRNDLKPIPVSYTVEYEVQEVEAQEVEVPELESMGEFKLTAYCSCAKCCTEKWANNRPKDENGNEIVIGASGEVLEAGKSIAVDPKVIPYGTTVLINGNEYIAQDCGGAIKKKRIDVYFDNHKDALEFGVQYAEIFIRREKENGS
jgi:3D (Asp-Asp-Asp) domain-containing protein